MRIAARLLVIASLTASVAAVDALLPFAAIEPTPTPEQLMELATARDLRVRLADGAEGWWTADGLAVHRDGEGSVRGILVVPTGAGAALGPPHQVRIALPAALLAAHADPAKVAAARRAWLRNLVERGVPGQAWFRHRLGLETADPATAERPSQQGIDLLMELVSGDRALAENLQLDRRLAAAPSASAAPARRLDELRGITIRELDWGPLVAGLTPPDEPLARALPADQHALLLASVRDLDALGTRLESAGAPLLGLVRASGGDRDLRQRYQRQMLLELGELGRRFGDAVVGGLAVTGGDPWFDLGSDVAVVFHARQPGLLAAYLATRQVQAVQAGARALQGAAGGHPWQGAVSADRAVSAYLMPLPGDLVAVANSTAQLERLAAVADGRAPALSTLPEFTVLRHRYPARAGAAQLFISDPAIRRWCSPRARIGDARRLRAAALLAEHAACAIDGTPPPPLPAWVGTADAAGLAAIYGGIGFLTPVDELAIDQVSGEEAAAYERWRDRFQAGWGRAFDPIALDLGVDAGGALAGDLTVLPLTAGSSYRELIDLARGATIAPGAGDRHPGEAARVALAVDLTSRLGRQASGTLTGLAAGLGADPLAWVGSSVHLYADAGPWWAAAEERGRRQELRERDWLQAPIALHIEVRDALRMTAFLIALRAMAEQAAPGMTVWETRQHHQRAYVRIGLHGAGDWLEAICYAASPAGLVVSVNEAMIQRHLDRVAAGAAPPAAPWPGDHLAVALNEASLQRLLLASALRREEVQRRSWACLPILDEWKRLFPDQDPVAVQARRFGERLACPGGGAFVWDEAAQGMASSVYGSPASPRPGPELPPALAAIGAWSGGVTWEHEGLRARFAIAPAP